MALFKEVNAKVIVLPKSDLNYKLKIVSIFLTPSVTFYWLKVT